MMRRKNVLLVCSIGVFFLLILFAPNNRVVSKSAEKYGFTRDSLVSTLRQQIIPNYTFGLLPNMISPVQEKSIKAGLLFDAKLNKIIWEKEINTALPIASLSKMMTALLVVEAIAEKKIDWTTEINITKEASLISCTKVFLKCGEKLTVEELLKAAMITSANDACYQLAEFLGGTEDAFVEQMNKKALQLGMQSTYFSNSTGLPASLKNKDNYSSPLDLLILTTELLKHYEVVEISSRKGEHIRSGTQKYEFKNHNKLVIEYSEVDGLKTGYTRKAGFCIAATANKENNRLISIVLGAPSPWIRNNFVAAIFNNYYNNVLCLGKLAQLKQGASNSKLDNSRITN